MSDGAATRALLSWSGSSYSCTTAAFWSRSSRRQAPSQSRSASRPSGSSLAQRHRARIPFLAGRAEAPWKVAAEHFEIREQNQATGTIMAERTATAMPFWGAGAWVGIYITPPRTGADSYRVEVVDKKKLVTDMTEQR
jgi:hypothetical protein